MSKRVLALLALASAATIAACGGGGHSGSLPPTTGAATQPTQKKTGKVTIALSFPAPSAANAARHREWISPNTASISIVVVPSGSPALPAVTVEIQPTLSSDCSGTTTITCSVGVPAVLGTTNAFTVNALSSTNAVLSTATQNVTLNSTGSGVSPIAFTLDGVLSSIAITFSGSPDIPLNGTVNMTVAGLDASGAAIVGAYTQPITLAPGAGLVLTPSGVTTIANSSAGTFAVAFTGAPTYNAAPTTPVQITASNASATASATITPTSTQLIFPIALPTQFVGYSNIALAPNGSLDFVVQNPYTSNGVIGSFNPSTAALTETSAAGIGFYPGMLAVDSNGNIWVSNNASSGIDTLNCFTSPTAAGVPVALPTPVSMYVDIQGVAGDLAGHVWFTDYYNQDAGVFSAGAGCSGITTPTITSVTPYDSANSVGPVVGDPAAPAGAAWVMAYQSSNSPYENVLIHVPFSGVPQANVVGLAQNVYGAFDFATDGLGNTFTTIDGDTTGGIVGEIPSGGTTIPNTAWFVPTVPSSVTSNLVPTGVAAYGTSASNETVAFTSQNGIVIGLYNPTNPAGTFQYVTEPGGCSGISYDATGNLWALCGVNGQAYMDKLVITSAWNLFYNPNASANGTVSSLITMAGGATGATYTATCTGQLTCPTGSFSGPTFFVVGQGVAVSTPVVSTGTVTVSDGTRSETITIETTSTAGG